MAIGSTRQLLSTPAVCAGHSQDTAGSIICQNGNDPTTDPGSPSKERQQVASEKNKWGENNRGQEICQRCWHKKGMTLDNVSVHQCFSKAMKNQFLIIDKKSWLHVASNSHSYSLAPVLKLRKKSCQLAILPGWIISLSPRFHANFLIFALSHAEQVCFVSPFPEWANNGNYPTLLTGCSLLSQIS